ncbi:DUF305 domain-containing protein [Pseudarthrobacter sp. R1]|uniref:DUF305 domain-containing protein n=1 Tax=Pseudarthrobacter sp. R1 TaxID=2944934 RepID=UPI002108D5E3|nr:DUF305 domain-containing protein [Pseudarthrobacter sp. R1]MCQ6273275.1 DUF305 domain-containing protein [Pseudarthrobacter sp. R1]
MTVFILTALAFFAVGRLTAAPQLVPDDGPDAGFARDMQAHHAQAVEMALTVRDTSSNEEIRAVAYDIATTQQHQSGQMYAWLQGWGLSQAGQAAPMAWMGTGDHGADHQSAPATAPETPMAGMATPEQLQALRSASGADADRLFTDLMIRHHQGGVAMATAAVNLAETARVRDFAAGLAEAQNAEILALQELRARL